MLCPNLFYTISFHFAASILLSASTQFNFWFPLDHPWPPWTTLATIYPSYPLSTHTSAQPVFPTLLIFQMKITSNSHILLIVSTVRHAYRYHNPPSLPSSSFIPLSLCFTDFHSYAHVNAYLFIFSSNIAFPNPPFSISYSFLADFYFWHHI